MSKKPDLFARFSLDYADHPKIASLSDAAFRAHVTFILYSRKYKTDGIIKNPVANRLALQWDADVLSELQNNDNEDPSLKKLENGDYYLTGYEEMQETRAEIEERRRIAAENGRKGGRPKGSKNKPKETHPVSNPVSNPGTQNKAETETEAETDISISNPHEQPTLSLVHPEASADASDRFEEFWKAYPKRSKANPKKPAREKFERIIKTVDPQILIDAAKAYAKSEEGNDPKYIAQTQTWLNQERWNDDYETQSSGDDSWNKLMNWTGQN